MTSKQKVNERLVPYLGYVERILPTGSRIICSPPVTGTDEDYIVLVTQDNRIQLESLLWDDDWYIGGSGSHGNLPDTIDGNHDFSTDPFILSTSHSYVNGKLNEHRLFRSWKSASDDGHELLNIILTCNEQYFDDFTRATFLAKALNLREKKDRVTLFRALCQDDWEFDKPKRKKTFGKYGLIYTDYAEAVQVAGFEILSQPPETQVVMTLPHGEYTPMFWWGNPPNYNALAPTITWHDDGQQMVGTIPA